MSNNLLLILERSNSNLVVDKDSGDYVLEGIFAQFGVENNNNRIYTEKEYLPHLEYLKKKISENRLMGELDHPEKFEISLDKVSHIIEALDYDANNRQIRGRVRILDTPAGKIARSLIDSNVPISISSRAAGSVSESKKVSIKRIFTFDLVADPGFEDAQLSRINESFGLDQDSNIQIFDAHTWTYGGYVQENQDTPKNEEIKMSDNYVTVESLNKYSLIIKEEIDKLNELYKNATAHSNVNESANEIANLTEEVRQLKEYANFLASEIGNNRKYAGHLRETINHSIDYSEKEVGKRVEQIIEYVDTVIAPNVDKMIGYQNYLAENLNSAIGYVDNEIAPHLDKSLQHADYLAEEIQKNREYATYLSESVTSEAQFKSLIDYTEFMFENNAGIGTDVTKSTPKGRNKNINESQYINNIDNPILESTNTDGITKRAENITNKIDLVLEQIKKEKIANISEANEYPFLTLINEENRAIFADLTMAQKEKVKQTLLETKSFDKEVLNSSFHLALFEGENPKDVTPAWLSKAPSKYKAIYESLDESEKDRIHAMANWYSGKLETKYQINNFWQTRGLDESIEPEVDNVLNEAIIEKVIGQPGMSNTHHNLGYSADRVSAIRESLNRYK